MTVYVDIRAYSESNVLAAHVTLCDRDVVSFIIEELYPDDVLLLVDIHDMEFRSGHGGIFVRPVSQWDHDVSYATAKDAWNAWIEREEAHQAPMIDDED